MNARRIQHVRLPQQKINRLIQYISIACFVLKGRAPSSSKQFAFVSKQQQEFLLSLDMLSKQTYKFLKRAQMIIARTEHVRQRRLFDGWIYLSLFETIDKTTGVVGTFLNAQHV